jgi:hypothetical protein
MRFLRDFLTSLLVGQRLRAVACYLFTLCAFLGAMCPGGCHASMGWIHQIKRRKWYQIEARNQQTNMLILSFSCDAVEAQKIMEKTYGP